MKPSFNLVVTSYFLTEFLPLFLKEETTKECPVIIIDDSLYENEEKFYVTLISHLGSRINNERNSSVVVIAPDVKDGKITHYNNRLHFFLNQASGRPNAFPCTGRGFQLINALLSTPANSVSYDCLKSGDPMLSKVDRNNGNLHTDISVNKSKHQPSLEATAL